MEGDWEGEVVHEGWLTKSPPLETKTRQIFSQTLIQPVSVIQCPEHQEPGNETARRETRWGGRGKIFHKLLNKMYERGSK